ncbi:UbiA family prenyltransferase [Singulisphaera sp. Ch08]|uniref:UbiA family prenyltransferase n=1 Tax=Singulisphaera sp. Ch08 TaxID=3120278 RepID=A0AAU7CF04_9BACT
MAIKPYLQLIRLPNVFTAAADSLAGWLLVRGSLESPERWLPLVGASMAIYAAGIALNDVFDYEIDLKERPARPLPSGRVSRRFAAWGGGFLLLLGPALAALSGSASSLIIALSLAACVLAYNLGLKRTILGPEVMGSCRALNLILGMSQAANFGGPGGWLVACSLGLFVVGVTWISRSETETGRTRGLYLGLTLENVAFLGLLTAALQPRLFPAVGIDSRSVLPLEGLLVLLLVAWVVNLAGARALRNPVPASLQQAVKTGVLSLVWLNVGVVAAVRGPATAVSVAILWIPAYLLGRWIYST